MSNRTLYLLLEGSTAHESCIEREEMLQTSAKAWWNDGRLLLRRVTHLWNNTGEEWKEMGCGGACNSREFVKEWNLVASAWGGGSL